MIRLEIGNTKGGLKQLRDLLDLVGNRFKMKSET